MTENRIIYTHTDEAPALATYSLLPIIEAFAGACGVPVETRDISLAGRIIAAFPEKLSDEQKVGDHLAELGKLALEKEANIIKLPNISASIPQLKEAVAELQAKGYDLPDFPDSPATDDEKATRARYDKLKGSAVNPVLREGNSDRRAPTAVKNFAKNNPHSMGTWSTDSKTSVATMSEGDFCSNEKSVTIQNAGNVRIELVDESGTAHVLKEKTAVLEGEIIDATYLSVRSLNKFLDNAMSDAKEKGILFSLHMKATMMKVSDPIIFGHAVKVFFKDVFDKHQATFDKLGVNANNGFANVLSAIEQLGDDEKNAVLEDIDAVYASQADIAMVDSDKGITNLHVPSDVIIDASMPAMIRSSGQMWNNDGKLQDALTVIPDSSYAGVYDATIEFCRKNGAFDVTTMGTTPNVGLMAKKAEEYGSHDKTFEVSMPGKVRVVDDKGDVLMEHKVEAGDLWRMCQAKDAPIKDWVKLAVTRARASGMPAVFWLDANRAHDAELLKKVDLYLKDHDTSGLDIRTLAPKAATEFTLARVKEGKDTISVTGNVLRDYLTDLFPILELGTSAKMLSIVPLMNGGGLFETGAGGSAPKHVQQFEKENHLRWDSLGEFLALGVSLDHLGEIADNKQARLLGAALDKATEKLLLNAKSPSRKVNEIDNRGSHFFLAMYWAEALAEQKDDAAFAERFAPLAKALAEKESVINAELVEAQGVKMDIGGYYFPTPELAAKAMRPSKTFNDALAAL
ncbi:MAG: NADP-dependent isocitrate dehydrogenase [Deltaproteobacteria bacterium]|nr:NADP-dependent isocitrate dehydrogenase [Deltaproteobacteria bacterium]